MYAGLPIACSNRSPIPGILGDVGVSNPENPDDISRALLELIEQPAMRNQSALDAHRKARNFLCERRAEETFSLIAQVERDPSHSSRMV
jgi:glycosyltransferase involved in cell wall biosynthesis